MIELAEYSYWVALGALFLQCVTVYLFVEYFFLEEKYLTPYIVRFGLALVCVVGAVSAILSLGYSEVFGFVPCGLCWIERGLLYSLSILSGMALWKKYTGVVDTAIADYGIGLSIIAGAVSFYHHYGQIAGGAFVVCPSAGAGADCARRLVFEFGYMTLPLMAFTTFAFFIAIFLIYRRAYRS
jgi:disulfide bond formation protein DsbB